MNTLPALIAEQAARTPDAIAVLGPATTDATTYAELLVAADQVAAHLRASGVRTGSPVLVRLPRGVGLVAALLGVWRAGGSYVPVDPAVPAARWRQLVDGVRPAAILDEKAVISSADSAFEPVPVDPADPAYIMHTSGSTGRPKGVIISHAGIANRVRWGVRTLRLGVTDRVLQKTTIGFDAAGWEIWAPLISGGSVVMAPAGVELDARAMLAAVADWDVTVLQTVPSVLRLLVRHDWSDCTALRVLCSAGEPLTAELGQHVLQRRNVELWNTYGPTECSIDATAWRFEPSQLTGAVPIGRPLPGLQVFVLDPRGRLAPRGVPGELYLGGVGVALGYHGQPAQSAEKFVPDPYGAPGARLYRTGDLARWNADGVLEYLGRLDDQVKLNGIRIEPAEIEAVIGEQPGVIACAIKVIRDRLVCYVVGLQPSRHDLAQALPASLVPSQIVPIDAIPWGSTGKLDRSALPEPAPMVETYVAPRSIAEQEVARAWSDLLGVDQIGAHDDFFRLGGSSLLLAELASRLGDVSLLALFTSTTVEAQAELLSHAVETSPIPVIPRSGVLPLSRTQQQFWLMDRLEAGSAELNAPILIRLPEATTADEIDTILTALARRHQVLRTRYVTVDGEPRAVIDAESGVYTQIIDAPVDLTDLLGQGFDLEHGPIWRAGLFRTPGQDHLLALVIHHIACDGWSSAVLAHDIEQLRAGNQLSDPPIQFVDYAAWQQRQGVDPTELAYWRSNLADLPTIELPTDRERPPRRSTAGATATFTIDAALMARVARVAQQHDASVFVALLTAWAVLLERYGAGPDIPVGSSVTGRVRPETHEVVGAMLNTVIMRCPVAAERGYGAGMVAVRDVVHQAFRHQQVPFDAVVDDLGGRRDPSRTPLYQTMFNFHEEGRTGVATDPADMRAALEAWPIARTDLTLVIQRDADGTAHGYIEYATALFDAATVHRMAGNLVGLLDAATADPALPVQELAIGRPVVESPTAVEPDDRRPIPDQIAAIARRDPTRVAVLSDGVSISYGQLDRRARRLARGLQRQGVQAEKVVAISLERGIDFVVAALGSWYAGAAYLPIDPREVPARRAAMIEDARATVVIDRGWFDHSLSDTRPGGAGPELVVGLTDPATLAYVMFTSGSTGRPKGVQVEHRNLATMIDAARDNLEFDEHSQWLALAAFTFDISAIELFLPLSTGGRVLIASDSEAVDHPAQLKLLQHGVTHLQVSPSHWQLLIEAGFDTADVIALTGGESARPAQLADIAGRVRRFFNEYGLTETTIAATCWPVEVDATSVSIGRPYPHVRSYLLDDRLRPVLPGATGELYLAGDGVTRGYLGRPGHTAERFLPDPFEGAGGRMYRTGDLCRERADGNLVFAGRADRQVKIRGRRVELGEIEAVLAEHPAVRAAVVMFEQEQLIAFCVADEVADAELIEHAGQSLPSHMVPQRIVGIEQIPLTRHSKIDFDNLRSRAPSPEEPTVSDAPRNKTEYQIAGLWADVLDRFVGVHDNFFEVGGNSIIATRLIATVRTEFGRSISMRAFFDDPTIAGLADLVSQPVPADASS